MSASVRKTYPITCACEKQQVFDIAVDVKDRPAARPGQQPRTWAVEKYCPFCDRMIRVNIPDEPADTGTVLKE